MTNYLYTLIHLPTGEKFLRSARFLSLREFCDNICRWNNQQPETWMYAPTGEYV